MRIFLFLVAAIFVFILFVRFIEKTGIFYPQKEIDSYPSAIGLEHEDVYFKAHDGVLLNGWFIRNWDAKDTILFFHGNAGNIGHRLPKIEFFYNLGLNVFIIDYRGYGRSKGSPSEKGLYLDAKAAYDYLLTRRDVNPSRIIAYGASIGGVAAADLLVERDLKAVIIDSSFTNAKDMAKSLYPFIPSSLLTVKMDSASKVSRASVPKLFFHSRDDEIVPFAIGQKLFMAAAEPKTFIELEGGHNTNYEESMTTFQTGIKEFLKEISIL